MFDRITTNEARETPQKGVDAQAVKPAPTTCRLSARSALLDEAAQLNMRAMRLQELARSIPENFPQTADRALYDLVVKSQR